MAGAILVVLCGAAGAFVLNSGASSALKQTESFIGWIRFIKTQIECFSMPISEILRICPSDVSDGCGYTCSIAAENAADFIKKCRICDLETKRQLDRFCAGIGKGYREEQTAFCDYYIELLENRRKMLSDQLPTRKKLNSVLCLSSALAVVILLI